MSFTVMEHVIGTIARCALVSSVSVAIGWTAAPEGEREGGSLFS